MKMGGRELSAGREREKQKGEGETESRERADQERGFARRGPFPLDGRMDDKGWIDVREKRTAPSSHFLSDKVLFKIP
jgi:hypothetical protein